MWSKHRMYILEMLKWKLIQQKLHLQRILLERVKCHHRRNIM